jgi:hypothetical protein
VSALIFACGRAQANLIDVAIGTSTPAVRVTCRHEP